MKNKLRLLCCLIFQFSLCLGLPAQGTAFTYQGQLQNNGLPVNGRYDVTFRLFNASFGGAVIAGPFTNSATSMSNGLFTALVDFGPGAFTGGSNWLELAVRTNGGGGFSTLAPRQQLTPTPYAMTAENLPGFQIQFNTNGAPNIIEGASNNVVSGTTTIGATIGGGGVTDFYGTSSANSVTADFGTVGGGAGNTAGYYSAIGGGENNTANGGAATVGGGSSNHADSDAATVAGGSLNNAGDTATIGGGYGNTAFGVGAYIGGGGYDGSTIANNFANGNVSVIGGGLGNNANGTGSTVSGGESNNVSYAGDTVGGGNKNSAAGGMSVVTGGQSNNAGAPYSFIGGGADNSVMGNGSTVAGGSENAAAGQDAVVGGGQQNNAGGLLTTVGGGLTNSATGTAATISGGANNVAGGGYATVPGGSTNIANGANSFAAGDQAEALHDGSFVWADREAGAFASTAPNQFSVRASGGIRLAGDLVFSGGNAYHNLSLSGGNSAGYLYGSYPALGDGIHLGYNYYNDATGVGHYGNTGGATSRISVGYGTVGIYVGGVYTPPMTPRIIADTTGVTVYGTFDNSSDRNAKQDFAPVDPARILEKVGQLPISEWSYKEDPKTRHVGPMGQDFYATFNIGTDEKHIAPIDEGGVALAAIQALNKELEEQKAENAELKARLDALEQIVLKQKSN
jgi:hypothetical protein